MNERIRLNHGRASTTSCVRCVVSFRCVGGRRRNSGTLLPAREEGAAVYSGRVYRNDAHWQNIGVFEPIRTAGGRRLFRNVVRALQ